MPEIKWIDPATGTWHHNDHICNQQCRQLKAEARAKMTEDEKDAEHLEYLKWATDIERILIVAENSESTEAITLAAEVRRLRKELEELKNGIKRNE